jgi:signal transduction histidine kinase
VVERGLDAVRASRGALWQLDATGTSALLASRGYSGEVQRRLAATSVGDATPVGSALRTAEPVWARSPDELRARFPTLYEQLSPTSRTHTYAAIPLAHRGQLAGAMLLCFTEASAPGVTDAALTTLLAQAAAGALLRARAFDAQREARREAELVAQARSDVLGVVAHDLRNPLNLISSTTSLLLDEALPLEQQRQMLQIGRRGVRQMDRLIEDLLDATRLQAGRLTLALTDVDVGDLVRQVEETCRPAADQHGVTLAVEARADARIRADEGRLLQALGNLVGNALKFTQRDGRVVLVAERAPDGVVFRVVDDGPGIPADALPRLFDRFWQARDGDRRGAGLGLAIAKGIVEAHGGRIWVESTPGAGSVFSFAIPTATSFNTPRQDAPSPGA